MSFQEKSLWLMLGSLALVFGFYFVRVTPAAGLNIEAGQIGLFLTLTVALVIIQIAGHAALAILDRRTTPDERDRIILLRGSLVGSQVLATGVFFSLVAAITWEGNFIFTHCLLASWLMAQLAEIGTQLYFYRREA